MTDTTPQLSSWVVPEPVIVGPAPGYMFVGFWRRFWAFLVDGIIVAIPTWIIGIPIVIGTLSSADLRILSGQGLYDIDPVSGQITTDPAGYLAFEATIDRLIPLFLLVFLGFALVLMVYCAILWTTRGATLGQMLLGVQIRNERDGSRIGFGRGCLRYLGYLISTWAIYIGFIWIAFDRRKQGWHDKIAGTVAVRRMPGYIFGPEPQRVSGGTEVARQEEASIPERLGDIWRRYRASWRLLLAVSVLVQGGLGLLMYPATVGSVGRFFGTWPQLRSVSNSDTEALRQTLSVLIPVHDPLSLILTALSPGLGVIVTFALVAIVATWLHSPDGRDRRLRRAAAAVRAAWIPILVPAVAFTMGQVILVSAEASWLNNGPSAATSSVIALGELVLFGVFIVGVYAVGRWSIAIPALVVEHLGWRAALSRSADLTHGRRTSVVLTFVLISLLSSLVDSAAIFVPSLLLGPEAGLDASYVVTLLLVLVTAIVLAPILPLTSVSMYEDFTKFPPRGRGY